MLDSRRQLMYFLHSSGLPDDLSAVLLIAAAAFFLCVGKWLLDDANDTNHWGF